MIRAILFDFDGVIHDTFDLCYKINRKVNPSLDVESYKNFFNGNIYDNKKEINPVPVDKFFKLQEREFEYLMIEEDIKEELIKLKKKYKLFIVTSNKETTLKKYFARNNLHDLFEEILGIETHKSKVEKFKILLKKYRLESKDCIFITDTLGDILEAKKLNIDTIAVDYGFHDSARLKKGNPRKIISHLKEVEIFLK